MEVSGQLHAPAALSPGGKNPRYLLDIRLGGPQSLSGRCGEEKNLALPGIEAGPSSQSPVAIPTELSLLLLTLRPRNLPWSTVSAGT
jgi:hypothetical protein